MPTFPKGATTNPNRLVAVLTPLVFAPLAGAIAAGVAKYGIDVDDGQVQAIFIAGATIALAKSAQWTKGWQAFESRDAVASEPIALDDDEPVEDEDELDDTQDAEHGGAFDEPELVHDADDDLHAEIDDDFDMADDADDDAELSEDPADDPADDLDEVDVDDDMDDFEAEAAGLLAAQGS